MSETNNNFEKFLALPEEKRERILNAAMKEFLQGYKKASTDNIVREAGISKGLLFHYFETKEKLYNFLIDNAIEIMQHEYVDLINTLQPDIFESIWQLSLLKRDVMQKYPAIFDFATAAHVDTSTKNDATSSNLHKFSQEQAKMIAAVYAQADTSLFRDDICHKTAMEIISWTLLGYGQSKLGITQADKLGQTARENYDTFLAEFEKILTTLKKCLYKEA